VAWLDIHLYFKHILPRSPTMQVKEAFSPKYRYLPPKFQGTTYHKTWDIQILAARSPKFYTLMPNICGSSVWNLLNVTLLRPRILRWLTEFWKICEPLQKTVILIVTAGETSHIQFSFTYDTHNRR